MPLLLSLAASPLLVLIVVAVIALLVKSLRVANQYERSVVFRGALARLYVRVPGVSLDSRVMRGANERLARR